MKSFFLVCFLFTSVGITAQNYSNAIGLRGGLGSGVTYKHQTGSSIAYEALFTGRNDYFNLTLLVEKYNPLQLGDNFSWYYGAGAHIGQRNSNKDKDTDFNLGVDGILGLEYNFSEIPINLSLDWKPEINIIGNNGFIGDGIAGSIRYYW